MEAWRNRHRPLIEEYNHDRPLAALTRNAALTVQIGGVPYKIKTAQLMKELGPYLHCCNMTA
jgi:hypothetical protein